MIGVDTDLIDQIIFGQVSKVLVTEYKDTIRILIHRREIGTATYELVNKEVSWGQNGDKTDGCLYETHTAHCAGYLRTLEARLSEPSVCYFEQIGIIGKYMSIFEIKKTITIKHPECQDLIADINEKAIGVDCSHERNCVPRWQKGEIAAVIRKRRV